MELNVEQVEKSIIKTYRKEIWRNFVKAINDYNLIDDNDKIAVCISGGKDSFLLAKCFQELKKHGKKNFDIQFIMVSPGYSDSYKEYIKKLAFNLNIPLQIFDTDIFEVVKKLKHKSNCYICAKMRRGYLYSVSKDLGCNKIALGHHMDDVFETTLLNMFYNGNFETMKPILNSSNYENMKLIRPLYYVEESSIIKWKNYNKIEFKDYNCGFKESDSKRYYLKSIINELRKDNKFFNANFLNALENVNVDNLNGYIKECVKYKNY